MSFGGVEIWGTAQQHPFDNTEAKEFSHFQPWPRAAGKQLPGGILAKPQVRPTACGETSLVQVEHALDLAWAPKSVLQFLPESTRGTCPSRSAGFSCLQPSKYARDLQAETNIYILLKLLTFSKLRAEGISMRLVSSA